MFLNHSGRVLSEANTDRKERLLLKVSLSVDENKRKRVGIPSSESTLLFSSGFLDQGQSREVLTRRPDKKYSGPNSNWPMVTYGDAKCVLLELSEASGWNNRGPNVMGWSAVAEWLFFCFVEL